MNAPPIRLRRRAAPAFSLVELVVVLGLVAILTTGGALALRNGPRQGLALRSAASTTIAALGAARHHAIAQHGTSRLLIAASPDARERTVPLLVEREEPRGSGTWIAAGPAWTLPRGVRIQEPSLGLTGIEGSRMGAAYGVAFDADGRSVAGELRIVLGTDSGTEARRTIRLRANGSAVGVE